MIVHRRGFELCGLDSARGKGFVSSYTVRELAFSNYKESRTEEDLQARLDVETQPLVMVLAPAIHSAYRGSPLFMA